MSQTRILRDIAIARSGDKGDRATLSVIARDPADYPRLAALLTLLALSPTLADTLWQIGTSDNSTAEFAFAPADYRAYRAPGFFVVMAQTRPDKVDEVVSRIRKNLDRAKAGQIE